ncbi:hypothetical protein SH661x_001845 [Planctomicrobium sp. SH661]|uniref:hypothetical protein n=1 Tax=Planctomicrobium sp. SH661 TaxID=3448124 RepID=UPI003F5B2109
MKFPLGQTLATPAALKALEASKQTAIPFLARHARGDWGDCCLEDAAANDAAVLDGDRIFSVYHTADGTKIWVITEADRSATTVLLPEDY